MATVPMSRRTRERILDAAAAVFREPGYSAAARMLLLGALNGSVE